MRQISKRILSMLIALTMILSIVPYNTYAAGTAEGSTESVDDPVEATENAQVYFVVSATKKVITLNGTENDPIDCNTDFDKNNVPDNGKFTIYYGNGNTASSEGKTVVNFTCDAVNTSWKADDKVYQIAKRTNPSGWESVMMEPQGDGTVAFRSCANGKYVSIQDGKLVLVDDETTSSNEKFIPYTDAVPKAAKKVQTTSVSGDSVTLSWEGVDKCIYTGYQVLYSTSENGKYTVAGEATSATEYTVTNLKLDTRYYFKVRTITNNDGGPYKDSAVVYTTTRKDYKPSVPQGLSLNQNNDGSMNLSWEASASAKGYKIYRAESRFAEYKEIADVSSSVTAYTDKAPNSNKYDNFYKVMAYNDADQSELSDPTSVEISMFGVNTYIFSEKDDVASINEVTSTIFEKQHYQQFGEDRYAIAFKSGDYTGTNIINVGYYTQILGLGKTPYDVQLNNVHAPAALSGNNATCNFWVGIENVMIKDTEQNGDDWFNFKWSVSQAAPARRLYVERTAQFDWNYGWASGGYVADSYFEKQAGSYSQQQYYYRNCHINNGVYGVNWNNVIQGCSGVTAENSSDNSGKPLSASTNLINNNGITNWDQRGCTTIVDSTPEIREKPFLYFDNSVNEYKVFVPAMRKDSQSISWSYENMGEGTSISVDDCFYVANAQKDTAATINRQLALGKNIIFSPGVYHAEEPIKVTRANTILLGLGMASIIPDNEECAIKVSDVGGVSITGLIIDAGNYSKTLITVGDEGCNKEHSDNPIVLQDVIYRVGGAGHLGRTDSCLVVNSNNTIVDHTWIWRADHGDNTGWYANTAKNGLVVNGDNVTTYGLFCEHFQEYDILWRGENGTTYFLQNEKCYDPQDQAGWMSHNGTKKGYAAYKVANNVKNHYAVGLGVYDVFINTNGASIFLDNAIEVPDAENVLIENACIVEIANGDGPKVGINHIVNSTTAGIRTGAESNGGYAIQRLLNYCNNKSVSLNDYYENDQAADVEEEAGEAPTTDINAEKDIQKEASSKDDEKPIWDMTDDDYLKVIEAQGKNAENITVVSQPSNLNYVQGQKLSLSGLVVKITYLDGSEETVSYADFRGYNITTSMEDGRILAYSDNGKTITIQCNGKSTQTAAITVVNRDIYDIAIKFQPLKLSYVEGEKLDLSGLEVTVTFNDGETAEIEYARFENFGITTDIATGTVLTNADNGRTVKITYGSKTIETSPIVMQGAGVATGNQQGGDNTVSNNDGTANVTNTAVTIGKKFTVGKLTYKITSITGKKGKVTVVGVKKKYVKKLKTIKIKATVKYSGYTFKITAIGKKAFANCKKLKKVTVKGKQLKKVAKTAFYKKMRKKITVKAGKKVKKVIRKSLGYKK